MTTIFSISTPTTGLGTFWQLIYTDENRYRLISGGGYDFLLSVFLVPEKPSVYFPFEYTLPIVVVECVSKEVIKHELSLQAKEQTDV
jgi:hypothetical protein